MAEDSSALDCTAQIMAPQEEPVRAPAKDQNAMENGRTTKLYYERFVSLEHSMMRVALINFFLLVLYVRRRPFSTSSTSSMPTAATTLS